MKYHLAIIGDGPATTGLLQQFNAFTKLAIRFGVPIDCAQIEVTAIGRNEIPGSGTPFSEQYNHHQYLSNVPPNIMSCRHVADPDMPHVNPDMDFCHWYRENYGHIDAWFPGLKAAHPTLDFSPEAMFRNPAGDLNDPKNVRRTYILPRIIYGKYYEQRHSEAIEEEGALGMTARSAEGNVIHITDRSDIIAVTHHGIKERHHYAMLHTSKDEGKISFYRRSNPVFIRYKDNKEKIHTVRASGAALLTGHALGSRFKNALKPYMPMEKFAHNIVAAKTAKPSVKACVLGASLSAIDSTFAVLSSYGHWVKGTNGNAEFVWDSEDRIHIDMRSRRGLLPKVRGQKQARENLYFHERWLTCSGDRDKVLLEKMFQLLNRELELVYGRSIEWHDILRPSENTLTLLKKDIQRAATGDIEGRFQGWEGVFLNVNFDVAFNALSAADQTRFLRDYKAVFDTYGAPMPPYNAQRLAHLMEHNIVSVEALGENAEIKIAPDGKTTITKNGAQTAYDYAIDGTNQLSDVSKDGGLGATLSENQQVAIHPVMGSIRIDPDGHNVLKPTVGTYMERHMPDGVATNLWGYGPGTLGDAFWASSVIDVSTHAKAIALTILNEIVERQAGSPQMLREFVRFLKEVRKDHPDAVDAVYAHIGLRIEEDVCFSRIRREAASTRLTALKTRQTQAIPLTA